MGKVQQLQLNLGKWEKLQSNLGENKKHLDKLETIGWSPSVESNFANLQQLHLIVGNFKQSC